MAKKIYLSPERRPAPHGPYAVGGVYEHDVCNEIAALEKAALERCGFNVVIAPRAETMEQRVSWAAGWLRVGFFPACTRVMVL